MKLLYILLLCSIFFVSCKNENNQTTEETATTQKDSLKITKDDITKIKFTDIGLDPKTNKIMSVWQAYQTLADALQSLKQADYTFFNSDIEVFNSAIKDLEETIPPDIKTQSVEARVLAFKTMLLNLKDLKSLTGIEKKEILVATKQVFVAFSNLNLQINKKVEKDSQNIERPY